MIPKFRVWDKLLKQMYYPEDFKITFNRGETVISTERELGWVDWEEKHINKDIFLMQSTGLLDKNGVEIYEGDIIGWRYVITYVDSSQPGNLGMSIGFYAQRDDFESYHMLDVGDEYEVLGNIYKNPELLEVSE